MPREPFPKAAAGTPHHSRQKCRTATGCWEEGRKNTMQGHIITRFGAGKVQEKKIMSPNGKKAEGGEKSRRCASGGH